jgi:hypothetical protein
MYYVILLTFFYQTLHEIHIYNWKEYIPFVHSATSRTVSRSIPGGATGEFFLTPPDRTMCLGVDSSPENE